MIRHYWIIALRNLWKNKGATFINIVGLTVGLSSCILIGLFIADELSYDKFHKDHERIVRTTMEYRGSGDAQHVVTTGTRVGPRFASTFPWVEGFVRTMKASGDVTYGEKSLRENKLLYADSAFFRIFSFPLLQGDPNTALQGYDRVVMTASAAHKYFGSEDAVGKTIKIGAEKTFIVSAVAADVPSHSQIQFDFVLNFAGLPAARTEEWWTANYITYLKLKPNTDLALAEKQVVAYMRTPEVKAEAGINGNGYLIYRFEPLAKVHLYSKLDGFEPNGNIAYVYILGAVALLILIIACVNYTNLAIAQSVNRSGEIGIRKVLGAGRKQLFYQFIGESALISFGALALAVLLCSQLLPVMNDITGKHFTMQSLLNLRTLLLLVSAGVVLSFLAGAYPALVLSGAVITSILKNSAGLRLSGNMVRKALIVVQFVIGVFLISTTLIIRQQMKYIRSKDLGYDKDHVLALPIDFRKLVHYDALREALLLIPGVSNVSGAYDLPTDIQWGDGISANTAAGKQDLQVTAAPVDMDYINTMNMELIAGSNFSPSDLALMDTSNNRQHFRYTYILNESAVKSLGWTPAEAIGQTIQSGADGTIKGVVKDFHFASMRENIGPLVIFMDKAFVRNVLVRFKTDDVAGLLANVESIWKERMPGAFTHRFIDDEFNRIYQADQRTEAVFSIAAGMAIFLACLGLFGLAAFTTAQRTKEIGIRKVLGAGVLDITALISKDFLLLVGLSLLVATPLAWLAAGKWLQDFAYRIHPGASVYLAAAIAVTLLALITVSFHAVRAALLNPVKSLRTE